MSRSEQIYGTIVQSVGGLVTNATVANPPFPGLCTRTSMWSAENQQRSGDAEAYFSLKKTLTADATTDTEREASWKATFAICSLMLQCASMDVFCNMLPDIAVWFNGCFCRRWQSRSISNVQFHAI